MKGQLSARSVVLSLLLGSHPDRMSPAQVTAAGEHFGIPASTLRVALTRAVAAGDLRREDGDYVLGERLVARQSQQDEAVEDAGAQGAGTAWDGTWEMAVVVVSGRSGSERAALRDQLAGARLAELREGVWTRPANLRRTPSYAGDPVLASFRARPDDDPRRLARELWDLSDWAATGRGLLRRLRGQGSGTPARGRGPRRTTPDRRPAAPPRLLPADWPGAELRTAYADYQAELRTLGVTDSR